MNLFCFLVKPRNFAIINLHAMKKLSGFSVLLVIFSLFLLASCGKEDPVIPCDGKGTLNISNKLDSLVTITVVESRLTKEIPKDYTLPLYLAGDQPYTINIDGPQYHKDTTIMLLSCDNKLLIVIK